MIKMLSLEDFKLIALEDKDIFEKFYSNYPQSHSDYLFSTMISWNDYGKYHFAEYKRFVYFVTFRQHLWIKADK